MFSNIRESKAMVVNTQVFPVPDLAWTIRSEKKTSTNNIISLQQCMKWQAQRFHRCTTFLSVTLHSCHYRAVSFGMEQKSLFWYCFQVISGVVPSPHLPSGIAFSWMGDGLWKPEADKPSSTGFDRSKELNSTPPLIRTSSVRVLDCSSCAAFMGAAIFLLRLRSVLRRWINELNSELLRPLAHRNRNAA